MHFEITFVFEIKSKTNQKLNFIYSPVAQILSAYEIIIQIKNQLIMNYEL